MATKVYKDGDTILLITDDAELQSKIAALIPKAYEEYEVMDLTPLPPAVKEKPSAKRSNFRNGTYKGLKPAEYVEKNGVEGALAMFSEKPIPEDMLAEVKRVCAQKIFESVSEIKDKKVTKDEFKQFVTTYAPFVKSSISAILKAQGYGNLDNYCEATDENVLQDDFKGMCNGILERAKKAL